VGVTERREDEKDEGEASWLGELSLTTLIVVALTALAIVGYVLVLIVDMFL